MNLHKMLFMSINRRSIPPT